jgi:predicted Fe-Mo cluster-binding NifX family protein
MDTIALTAAGPSLHAEVEPRFGRAPYVLFVDLGSPEWEAVKNPALNASGGAGIQLAELLCERRVTHVVSGEFGPKAHRALKEAGIAMHRCENGTSAERAIQLLREGSLPVAGAPDGRGWRGWGFRR